MHVAAEHGVLGLTLESHWPGGTHVCPGSVEDRPLRALEDSEEAQRGRPTALVCQGLRVLVQNIDPKGQGPGCPGVLGFLRAEVRRGQPGGHSACPGYC